MPPTPAPSPADSARPSNVKQAQIASWLHLVGFLLIGTGVVVMGMLAQHRGSSGGAADTSQLANHGAAISLYLTAIAMDWALLYYCWVGVHRFGGKLETLSGGLCSSWSDLARDIAIAIPFWLLWEGAAWAVHWLLELGQTPLSSNAAKTVDSLLPKTPLEVLLWIATSCTAGICEELAFRGYLQKQFHALMGNVVVAVAAQGVVFGLFHAYQGWKNVTVICVLGILYGALAQWRRNLRVNIAAHAWSDVWEGWLKFVVWK
jgi:membrane protease YdiL (CAAX protease family)